MIRRRKFLARGKPPRRGKRPNPISDKQRASNATLAELRPALIERSGGHCEARYFAVTCTGVGVHAHHVKPRSAGGGHTIANLKWICAPCHQEIHARPAEAAGMWIRSPGITKTVRKID